MGISLREPTVVVHDAAGILGNNKIERASRKHRY